MLTEEEVKSSLEQILVPGVMRSLVKMNLIRGIEVKDGEVKVTLASTAMSSEAQNWLRDKVASTIRELNGVKAAMVDFVEAKPKELNQIQNIVAVMSGKGGVGKSLVAGLLASYFAREGKNVGTLDADITGPSIPKMFGLNVHPSGSESGILPILTRSGIEVMSMNLLLPSEDETVIWRGPLMSKKPSRSSGRMCSGASSTIW
jgi:hydrogenase maturation protease